MKVLGKFVIVLVALVLGLTSCSIFGGPGDVYMAISWEGDLHYYPDELPAPFSGGGWTGGTYYQITPGQYYIEYEIEDGGTFYPGNDNVYYAYLDLEADKGGLFTFSEDTVIDLYLTTSGTYIDKVLVPRSVSTEGSQGAEQEQVYQLNGYTLRVRSGVKSSSDSEVKSLHVKILDK